METDWWTILMQSSCPVVTRRERGIRLNIFNKVCFRWGFESTIINGRLLFYLLQERWFWRLRERERRGRMERLREILSIPEHSKIPHTQRGDSDDGKFSITWGSPWYLRKPVSSSNIIPHCVCTQHTHTHTQTCQHTSNTYTQSHRNRLLIVYIQDSKTDVFLWMHCCQCYKWSE